MGRDQNDRHDADRVWRERQDLRAEKREEDRVEQEARGIALSRALDDTQATTAEEKRLALEHARYQVRVVLVVLGLFALVGLAFSVALLLPFNPLTVHSYEAVPDEVCPTDLVAVEIDYELEETPRVTQIDTQSRWRAVDVEGYEQGQILEGEETPIREDARLAPGRRKVESKVLRSAPPAPGVWEAGAILTAHGERITQNQRVEPWDHRGTIVLPASNAKCRGAS